MKRLNILIILICIIQVTELLSQSCLPNGISFTTQSQIDNFQINHPGCTQIEGYVYITGNDIIDLTGINALTNIGGNLNIYGNSNLTSLTGFENLTTVLGDIHIGWDNGPEIGNYLLSSLSGLVGLNYIGGDFEISHSPYLTSLTGLESLTFVGGGLSINNNNTLTDLSALEGLTSIGSTLSIYFNFDLMNLEGMDNITLIGSDLSIHSNSSLNTLLNLVSVSFIGGNLNIWFNGSLTNMNGFNNLNSVGGEIYININNELTSLEGLENISAGSISSLTISYNYNLSECSAQSICDYLTTPGCIVDIQNNASGCNNQAEVEEECKTIGINENTKVSGFFIYPNPVSKELYISKKNIEIINEINIYNILGQIVLNQNHLTESIDISKLLRGMYIVELVSNDLKFRKIFIIK